VVLASGQFDSDRLRVALYIYGDHIPPCEKRPCTCGFLAEWEHAALPANMAEVMRVAALKELKR
jgi:hypothetical protein